MNNSPVISVIGPSARISGWMRLYSSLVWNTTPFEVIFAGPCKPSYDLPANFHHIKTDVKPTQCIHIAAKQAKGEYLFNSGDDVYYSRYCLDNLKKTIENENNDKCFATPLGDWIFYDPQEYKILASRRGKPSHSYFFGRKIAKRYHRIKKYCPVLPHQGLFLRKELYMQLEGPDSRFIARFWDHDMAMRIYEIEGSGIICEDAIFNEAHINRHDSIVPLESETTDKQYLYSLWCKSDNQEIRYSMNNLADLKIFEEEKKQCKITILQSRSNKIIPFDDKELSTKTQSPN